MRTILILIIATSTLACAGSKATQPSPLADFLNRRTSAIEGADPQALADTYLDDYLNVCETKPEALERWRTATAGATRIDVVDVGVSYTEFNPHIGLAHATATWRVNVYRGTELTVVYREEKHNLRFVNGQWNEWGEQSCQDR